ncbi:MAG: site-specific DNA-methyltransferase [Candidatus Nanoarchaeia archaeon]|nr:site-specific DNA-methyltransferase [Candidatus Nanoarchaeia archaeon]
MINQNKIFNIEAIEGLKKLKNESIDLVLTDPPYGLNKKGIKNDEDLKEFYKILPDCYRVLKKDSFFITFFSTKYIPEIFKNNPFTYYWQIVLYCPNGSVRSTIGYTKFMSVFIFKKGNPKIKKQNKDIFVDTPGRMVEPLEGFINHPTPKPTKFIKELLEMFSNKNDLVLDPFIGSGSTALACKDLERNFIGFEIEKKYYDLANKRLKNRDNTLVKFNQKKL